MLKSQGREAFMLMLKMSWMPGYPVVEVSIIKVVPGWTNTFPEAVVFGRDSQ